ncbi:NUDIX hydrolase [Gloeobacter violaceus]|uniref:Gll0925 protein n=1 Tax=Gloeobacter violaceus (strain ATCC 29082 / PCC 7421) TaxID=251221 RepID=Q7NM44_GLOVI|nr:NUDIX hydrolase [Gloeobacter violaceus]BAC88866.1 gll0925 [Gloeobacter violaceus PCC 7421]
MPADAEPRGPSVFKIPEGDNRERLVCPDCGFIYYDNPRIVTGAVCLWEDQVLLCRRDIEPRRNYWTLPAGYLELGETTEAGAVREAWEEARARIAIEALLGVYNVPRISQVQLIYRARLLSLDIGPGPESLEVRLFSWEAIPWGELAFPSVRWALDHFQQTRHLSEFAPRSNPPGASDRLEGEGL